jgi:hypothetical protein
MANMNLVQDVAKIEQGMSSIEQALGKGLMMPFNNTNSGSRKIMYSTQIEHVLPLMEPEPAFVQTGYENRFGEHSSSLIIADSDYEVVAKIAKFSFNPNHHYYLVFKDLRTGEYDILERTSYCHITETYGYLFNNNTLDGLSVGSKVNKGDTLKKSLAFDEFNNRQDGVNLITTYMSDEHTKEDGIKISRSAAWKLRAPLLKRIPIIINDNDIPLNIYGDNNRYKSMPDIGEYVQQGIVIATRREKKEECLFAQSYDRLRDIMMSDEKYTVEGKVVDINIYCNNPTALDESFYNAQLKYYYEESKRFTTEFVNAVAHIINDKSNKCSYELQKVYYDNKAILEGKQYIKDRPFSNTILELVVMEEKPMAKGDKLSNRYGGKGVVSIVVDDELMPLLETGERVEVIFNSSTCINRLNPGQLFETSLNHISSRLIQYMDMRVLDEYEYIELFLGYLSMVVPEQANELRRELEMLTELDDIVCFLQSIISDKGIMISMKPISESIDIDRLNYIYKSLPFATQYNVMVPQTDSNGNIRYITARRKLTCGRQYIYRLKQYAEEKFSATSLSTTNIRNENARNPAKKSYKVIHTKTPIKFGEMESGDMAHLGMENVIVNLLLHTASPHGRRLSEELLTGDPFNIDIKLDDMASNRGVEILNAYLLTMGIELSFRRVPKKKQQAVIKKPVCFAPTMGINNGRRSVWFVDKGEYFDVAYLDQKQPTGPVKPVSFVPVTFTK